MIVTRRMVMKSGLAAGAGLLASSLPVWANTSLSLGATKIDVVSDGNLTLPASFLFSGLPEDELVPILTEHGIPKDQILPDCNLTLVRDGERSILFDVGSGPNFMPSAGKVTDALEAIDVDPADITHVVFTHAHPDHLWGLLDDFDEPLFSEAAYLIGKSEWDYWVDPNTVNTIGDARQAFAAGAKRNLMSIEDKISFFKPGEEILPGIEARATFGHTPGHTSFEVRSGSESVMIVGDAIGNHHVAFEKPNWEFNSDQNKELGAKTRSALLDQIASQKMRLIGFHFPYPGIGNVEKKGEAYRFVAA